MEKPSERKRPFGVIVIVVLQLISLVFLAIDAYLGNEIIPLPLFPGVGAAVSFPVSALIIVIYQLTVAFGLWQLKRWAWFLIMIQLGLSMLFGLWFYINDVPQYQYMVFNVIMVFYLNQRDVQRAFERRTELREEPWTT